MGNHVFSNIVVTIISLFFIIGIGSILLSFFFDPKEDKLLNTQIYQNSFEKISSPTYSQLLESNDLEQSFSILIEDDLYDESDSTT